MFKSRLSNIYSKNYSKNSNVVYSNKKFAINYQPNYILGKFAEAGTVVQYFAFFTGTDSSTGTSINDIMTYLNCAQPLIQTITYTATSMESMKTILETSVVDDVGPTGAVEKILRFHFKDTTIPVNDPHPPQSWNLYNRFGNPIPPLNEYYYSFYFKLDANLLDRLIIPGGGAWFDFMSMKTGGYLNDLNAGDYRYVMNIFKDVDGLFYRSHGDNVADNSTDRKVVNSNSPNGDPMVNSLYWKQRTVSGTVRVGIWCKMEVYIKRPVNKDDVTTGVTWFAVTPTDTNIRMVVCNKKGGTQKGIQNLEVGRIFTFGHYCGGVAPIISDYTRLEWYDGFPYSPAVREVNNIMYDF